MTSRQAALAMATGLALAIGLFFLLPAAIGRALDPFLGSVYTLNLTEGAVRVGVLIAYIASIGRLPDIRRVFAYHGAEHKAVNAYEAGVPLDVASVQACSRFHPRCGTSFLLIVMVVAVIIFSFLGRPPLVLRLLSRVAFIPLVAGVSYEIIRAGARSRWFRPLVLPGLWLQRLTTRDPDDAEVEVAVRALREVVDREQAALAPPPVL